MHYSIKQIASFGLFVLVFALGYLAPQWNNNFNASILTYGPEESTLEDDIIRFHLQMNETTNEYLKLLTSEDQPQVDYPASVADCGESNVSTYCLSVVLNEELTAFEKGMQEHKLLFRDEVAADPAGLDEAVSAQAIRSSLADLEVDVARRTLDLTLAVYNETQLTYPVHNELLALIGNLEEYRDNLADIRSAVELYPSKFNNATTIQCK